MMERRIKSGFEIGDYGSRLKGMPRDILEAFSNNEIPIPIFDLMVEVYVPTQADLNNGLSKRELKNWNNRFEAYA